MSRTLVSVQTISRIEPIPGADRIVLAHVLGWKVIISKDMHLAVGDKVAYFETDSLLPESDPRYTQFMPRGIRHMRLEDGAMVTGHVLRTMKMRGVYSQGLVMRLDDLGLRDTLPVGTDITEACNVIKYDVLMTGLTSSESRRQTGVIGDFNAPCSHPDAPRAQTLTAIWDDLCALESIPTVKVDGTPLTFFFDGSELRMYGKNYELDPMNPNWRDACWLAREYFTSDLGGLKVFDIGIDMCVQAEYAGPGINGNRQKLAKRDLFVFAVWQDGEKLPRDEWEDSFLAHAAPEVNQWEYPLADSMDTLISAVDGMRGHITPDALDEGIVWHLNPNQTVPDSVREALGDNLCFKIINNTYLTKHHL